MKQSTVFAAALNALWEHAYNLKLEKRRPDYFGSGARVQTGKRLSDGPGNPHLPLRRSGKTTLACFLRRRSDRFASELRGPQPAIRHY